MKADTNRAGHSSKMRVEYASLNTYSKMSEISGNCRKIYVDNPKDRSKPTCLIHDNGHSSDKRKVLGEFGPKYAKIRPTKEHRHDPANKNKFNMHQDNNDILNHAVDEIVLKENNKVSSQEEAHKNIEYDIDENDLYQIDNMSLYGKKENTERHERAFESKLENTYYIEIQNIMTAIHGNKVNKLSEFNLLHDIINPPKCSNFLIAITFLFYKDV